MRKPGIGAGVCVAVLAHVGLAQTCTGSRLSGVVRDTTGAIVPGATVSLDGAGTRTSGADGRFAFSCVADGRHTVTASFQEFAPYEIRVTLPHAAELVFKMVPSAEASITVNADDDLQVQAPGGGNGLVVAGKQLQALADDPDDLLRELQQLSAASGGSPGKATISVDGFQDSATLPPKDSIAFINVSPDLFSAEYREPPFGGGRVEVYTKPGAKNYHGAVFGTNSSSWMNARDPFTTSTGSLGKQRYGFDLSGPVRRKGSNFALNLEHRSIAETVAVNAITPDLNGNPVNTIDTVPIPQHLWVASARVDWQLGPKNIAFVSYTADASHLENLGVGGQTLRIAGYDFSQNDLVIRGSDVTTISPKLVHEARASYEIYHATDIPASTAPSLQVAGYFTGGGASIGNARDRRSRLEVDDDVILNSGKHSIKTGIQFFLVRRNSAVPTNFNGSYVFSGVAPTAGSTSFGTALQQYQQAQTGGTASEFSNVAGNPIVQVSQGRFAGFFQDNVKLSSKWTAFFGLRYYFETDPMTFNGLGPRGGFMYSPDKKQTWVFKTHFGVFTGQYSADDAQELQREDGVQRVTSLIYNPVYGTPFAGATPIHALRTTAPGFNLPTYVAGDLSVSKDLPHGFNLNVEEVQIRFLTTARTLNINQPLVANPYGARPFGANVNILQARNDGTGLGHGEFIGLSNFKQKRVQFFVGVLRIDLRDNDNDNVFFQPQSAYSDAGEIVRRDDQGLYQVFGNATVALPYKLSLAGNGYAQGGQPFNLLTGADNNGDGNFNDRPQFAPAGAVANGTTVFQTKFGLLTNAGAMVNGAPVSPIVRNLGRLPWSFHLDANLQRAFKLTKNAKADHQQTVTVNVRSANFLNHTNVTTEGSVLGSPQFLVPVAADTARRVEVGLRYSF